MIPGHNYLSLVVPPIERLPIAAILLIGGIVCAYLFVRGVLAYAKWHDARGFS